MEFFIDVFFFFMYNMCKYLERVMDIAKKIVVSKWPEVYHMSQGSFDDWVLSLSTEDEDWIERKIVNVIFKKNFKTMKEVDAYIEDMDLADRGVLNKEKLFYNGIGKNFFSFNEQDNKGLILNNKTLYDYDHSEFFRQEKIIAEHTGDTTEKKYEHLHLFHDWCRLMVNDRLVYGTLDSLAAYVYSSLESFLDDEVEKIYPHKFVNGKDHGKPENGGFLWDMVIDANGKERQLESLKEEVYNNFFYKEFYDEIIKYCESMKLNATFVKRGKDEDGVSDYFYFIFTDREVAKKIHLNSFYEDVLKNESSNWEKLEAINSYFKEKLMLKLKEVEKNIEENFQENVFPLKNKKRNKIVVSGDLLDVLDDSEKDDD